MESFFFFFKFGMYVFASFFFHWQFHLNPYKAFDVVYVFPVTSWVHNIFFILFVIDAKSTLMMNFKSFLVNTWKFADA